MLDIAFVLAIPIRILSQNACHPWIEFKDTDSLRTPPSKEGTTNPEFRISVQDPQQADKLTKIQKDLDETKITLHQTIESMLERGEKLENLVDKSSDLSMASQMFYKQAKKNNQCCKMM